MAVQEEVRSWSFTVGNIGELVSAFCVGCGATVTSRRRRFCSESCREEFQQRRYDEAIQAGVLEDQAKDELQKRRASMPSSDGLRPITGSTMKATEKRLEAIDRIEEAE